MKLNSFFSVRFRLPLALLSVVLFAGCFGGSEQFDRASVTGQVVCEGKPVPNARVAFNPLRKDNSGLVGKQGFGLTDKDGRFTLSTYDTDDGAVIGKHSVRVWMESGGCPCRTGDTLEVTQVEVTEDGENDFTIKLPAMTAADRRQQAAGGDDDDDDDE